LGRGAEGRFRDGFPPRWLLRRMLLAAKAVAAGCRLTALDRCCKLRADGFLLKQCRRGRTSRTHAVTAPAILPSFSRYGDAGWFGTARTLHFGDEHGSGKLAIGAACAGRYPGRVCWGDRQDLDDRTGRQLHGRPSDRSEG